MHLLHCTNSLPAPILALSKPIKDDHMRIFSGLMGRRPSKKDRAYSNAMDVLRGMTAADCADIGIKPADFSRIAREMASR